MHPLHTSLEVRGVKMSLLLKRANKSKQKRTAIPVNHVKSKPGLKEIYAEVKLLSHFIFSFFKINLSFLWLMNFR